MSFLALRELAKTYADGTQAVRGIDLDVERGELLVLLGPSGCGKTSALRMIAGLETATRGRIELDGAEVTALPPGARDVGFVFQFYALYPHLSAAENIAFPLACAGRSSAEQRAAVGDLAARLGLTPLLGRLPRELSGGDQQRVSLARAMVRRPKLWLMDEPLGTLDADRRLDLAEFVRARQIEERVTTVYVTHDQDEAMRLADRIAVMSAGRIVQLGTPAEVYERPATLFAARFVGSPGINAVAGAVAARGGGSVFVPEQCEIEIPLPLGQRVGAALLGIRPEHVRVDAAGPIAGRVAVDEYLGSCRCLHVDSAAGRIAVRADADAPSRRGSELRLALDAAHVCLFDPRTEARVG